MKYYLLKQDLRVMGQIVLSACPGINPDEWIDGKTMSDPGPLHFSQSPSSGEFRGVIVQGSVTLFHKIFIEKLIHLGVDNFQHFTVEIEDSEGILEKNYSLINIIGLFEAVNLSESNIKERATGGRGQLYSFKIDESKTEGKRLFRIKEAPTLIIIDETLYSELGALKLPALRMTPTEEYDGWM